ncbi:MAG: helix-turn-helix domain-containing protein [Synergistaceae bacterium]|jgi:hypothetical protein|nr:helix-turn-helix domain-containing protein [Synergistaceae bacterium]
MLKNTLAKKRQSTNRALAEAEALAATTNETTAPTKPAITELPQLLSERDAAKYTGVSAAYLRRARTEGAPGGRTSGPVFVRLESFGAKGGRNGGRVLYPRADLDEWLSGLERKRVI